MSFSKFDAFTSSANDRSVQNEYCRLYSPVASPVNNRTIEFSVPPAARDFIDLTKIRLKVTVEITKANGEAIAKTDTVAPIGNSFYSLFSCIDVALNGTQMNQSESVNAVYKAYIDTLLERDDQYVKTQGVLTGFLKDTAFHTTSTAMDQSLNTGLRMRWMMCRSGKFEMSGFLINDIFKVQKYLPPGISLNLKFYLSRPSFYLMVKGTTSYTYNVTAATLYTTYISPSEQMYSAYHKALDKKMALFKYPRSDLSAYVIPSKLQSAYVDNIFNYGLPESIFIVMTENSSYSGDVGKNPLSFSHFGANYISVEYEGRKISGYDFLPKFNADFIEEEGKDAEMNYDHQFSDAYMNLFFNKGNMSQGCLISPDEYRGGYFILRYDVPESVRNQKPLNNVPQGLTRVTIKFDEALTDAITVLIYTRFTDFFAIDKHKRVLLYPPKH